MMTFDPFENRRCRDIRNTLSEGFLSALQAHEFGPLEKSLSAIEAATPLDAVHRQWVEERMGRYHWVLSRPLAAVDQPLATGALLWDVRLFYECHEWLEEIWLDLEGDSRKAVQGLIRACGAYVFVEAGRMETACKSAGKAHALLKAHAALVPEFFQVDLLMAALSPLNPTPPELNFTLPNPAV